MFIRIMGAVAGIFVNTSSIWGVFRGRYGIGPSSYLHNWFVAAFKDKGRFSDYKDQFGVHMVMIMQP